MIDIKELKAKVNNLYFIKYMEGKEKEKRRFKIQLRV